MRYEINCNMTSIDFHSTVHLPAVYEQWAGFVFDEGTNSASVLQYCCGGGTVVV